MKEKIDEMYDKYLTEKLDFIFSEEGNNPEHENAFYHSEEKPTPKQRQIMTDSWYSHNDFHEGFVIVTNLLGGKNYLDEKGNLLLSEWVNDATDFSEGYAVIIRNGKYNVINAKGEYQSEEWRTAVTYDGYPFDFKPFIDGFAALNHGGRGCKQNLIDRKGKPVFDGFFFFDGYTYEGFKKGPVGIRYDEDDKPWIDHTAFIYPDGKVDYHSNDDKKEPKEKKESYIPDKVRDKLCEKYIEVSESFSGLYKVTDNNGRVNYVDKDGKTISNIWFDYCDDFKEEYAIVEKKGKYNLLHKSGKLVSPIWYDGINYFHDGRALVKKSVKTLNGNKEEAHSKYGYIDTDGKIICELKYDYGEDFCEGKARVERDGVYNFINKDGKELYNRGLVVNHGYRDGYTVIKKDRLFHLVDKEGNIVSPLWFDTVEYRADGRLFINGLALVKYQGKYNYLTKDGNLLFQEGFDEAHPIENGIALIKKDDKYSIFNPDGELITKWHEKKPTIESVSLNFVKINDDLVCKKIDLYGFESKKTLFGYNMSNGYTSFKVKYKPIKQYGANYTICYNKGMLYLFDRKNKKYKELGSITDVQFDSNFIYYHHKKEDEKIYLMHSDKMLDITDYYKKHLSNKNIIPVSDSLISIIERKDFEFENMEKLDKFMEEERKKNLKAKEEKEKKDKIAKDKETAEKIRLQKDNDEFEKTEKLARRKQKILEIVKLIKELDEESCSLKGAPSQRFAISELFIKVDDHYEIREEFRDILKYIDLSHLSFEKVKVDGIDFSDCNIDLMNPQLVYKKNLKGCNFERVHLNPFVNFSGVDVTGCKFSEDENALTIDMMNSTLENSIYDETTTYNGIPIEKQFVSKRK